MATWLKRYVEGMPYSPAPLKAYLEIRIDHRFLVSMGVNAKFIALAV